MDPGDGPNHLRVRRDELLDVQPVLGGVAVLHAADLLADHRQGDGVPRGGKAGTVFHLLVPQNRDLLVHGLQQDRGGLGVLLVPIQSRILVHQPVQIPLRLIGGGGDPGLVLVHREAVQRDGLGTVDLQQIRGVEGAALIQIGEQQQDIHRQAGQQPQEQGSGVRRASAKLEKDRQRYQNLVQRNAATPIQLEQIETEYEATRKKLEATKRQQKAALSGVNEVSHRRESTEAAIQRATAALEMARLNLSYTVVVAPCDGKLGRRALEEGQFITAGQTITYILPDTQKWIVANYKETQVENLHIGQEVTITVDAISDKEFTGTITAISGATGSKYSLVPTDNSAGNFVKIQQRIPVRIDFTNLSKEDNEKLAAGMMVIVKAEL